MTTTRLAQVQQLKAMLQRVADANRKARLAKEQKLTTIRQATSTTTIR